MNKSKLPKIVKLQSGSLELGHIEATRFYKSDGCGFTGWVARDTIHTFNYSDPLPNEKEAREVMKEMYMQKW